MEVEDEEEIFEISNASTLLSANLFLELRSGKLIFRLWAMLARQKIYWMSCPKKLSIDTFPGLLFEKNLGCLSRWWKCKLLIKERSVNLRPSLWWRICMIHAWFSKRLLSKQRAFYIRKHWYGYTKLKRKSMTSSNWFDFRWLAADQRYYSSSPKNF